jgi:hypothetical protein
MAPSVDPLNGSAAAMKLSMNSLSFPRRDHRRPDGQPGRNTPVGPHFDDQSRH